MSAASEAFDNHAILPPAEMMEAARLAWLEVYQRVAKDRHNEDLLRELVVAGDKLCAAVELFESTEVGDR